MFLDLLGDFTVIGFFVAVWSNLQDWSLTQSHNRSALVLGSLMGLGAIAAMMFSVELSTGIHFDLRTVAIAIATMFGGPLSGCVAAGLAAAFRISMGGVGLFGGLLSIAMALVVGWIGNGLAGKRPSQNVKVILFTGVLLAVLPLIAISTLPLVVRDEAYKFAGPVVGLLSLIAFLLASYAISRNTELARHRAVMIAAIRQAPEYFYVKDADSRIVAANHNCAIANGFTDPASLIGKSDLDLSTDARAKELFQEEQLVLSTVKPMVDKLEELPGPHQSLKYYSTSKSPIVLGNGEVVGLVGVTKDISSLKLAEREAEEGRNRLAFVLEEMSEGVALIGHDGYIVMTNSRYRELFPRTGSERVAGAYFPRILNLSVESGEQPGVTHDDQSTWVSKVMHSLKAGGDEIVQLFGDRWLQIRTRSHNHGISTVVVSDISAMKRAEADLRATSKQLAHLAVTDELTRVPNRRKFDEVLQNEVDRALWEEKAISVLLIDIDKFKQFNDYYGHLSGDNALRLVASAISKCATRPADLVARYGGEEFGVVLSETTGESALVVADKIREAIQALNLQHERSDKGIVTVSVGIASMKGIDPSLAPLTLLMRADEALYQAKAQGRNCSVVWQSTNVKVPTTGETIKRPQNHFKNFG